MPKLGFAGTGFFLEPKHSWFSPLARMIDNNTAARTNMLCKLCKHVGMAVRPMVI